jgi:hypothetical protein
MGAHGCRNVKRKRTTSKEATASASASSEGVANDLMERKNKTNQLPVMKPMAQEEEAQPASAGKKTDEKMKRVVRERLPEKLIHIMIVHSHSVHEIPDEELARCSEEVHVSYAKTKARSEKWMADDQAIIDQYLINGYAESVWEVSDDEDDGDDDDMEEEIVDIIN